MKRILPLLLLVACSGGDEGPTAPPLATAALTGRITNANTMAPLDRAEVVVTQSGQSIPTLTASNGNYSFFFGLLPGDVRITARATGFETVTTTISVVRGSNRHDIQLRPAQ